MNLQFEHKLDNLWNSNIVGTPSTTQVTNWTSNVVPGANDDLLIPAGMDVIQEGQAQHFNTDDAAHTLTVANGASLISKSKLTIGGDFINSGTTTIFRGNTGLSVAGTIQNDGTFNIVNDSTATTGLELASGLTRLFGGGQVILAQTSPGYGGYIDALTAGSTLQNDSTILGIGNIGGRGPYAGGTDMKLINGAAGIIDGRSADVFQMLIITSATPVTNHGILRGSGAGGLSLANLTVQNSDGFLDGNGGRVLLNRTTIQGGTLQSSGAGAIVAQGDRSNAAPVNILDGSTGSGAIRNNGVVTGSGIGLKGSIVNTGTIRGGESTAPGGLLFLLDDANKSGVTLTGGGFVDLYSRDTGNSVIIGNSTTVVTTLHNVDNTIRGAGTIGTSGIGDRGNDADPHFRLQFDNKAGGTVNAIPTGGSTYGLTLGLSDGVTNAGLLEATLGGKLVFTNTTVTNTGAGTITAIGAGSHVDLYDSAIQGGTIASSGGGIVNVVANQTETVLDNTTAQGSIKLTGTLAVTSNATLRLKGTLTDTGGIVDQTSGNVLIDAAGATLNGAGSLLLSGGRIKGTSTSSVATLTNTSTISGGGFLGAGYDGPSDQGNNQLRIDNQASGTIVATNTATPLLLQNLASFTNTGTIDASIGGTLALVGDNVNSRSGTIHAGNGSRVTLSNSIVYGGTYATDGTGIIENVGTSPSTLDGASVGGAVTNFGTIRVNNNTVLGLVGNITNNGRILVGATDRTTQLLGGAVLTGSGSIDLSDSSINIITGSLTNASNTISGAGTISATLTNQGGGTIAAIYADQALSLTGTTLANDGILKADGGKLVLTGAVTGAGSFVVAHGGTLDIQGTSSEAIAFQDRTGTVRLSQATTAAITGFSAGDKIDIAFLNPTGLTTTYNANAGLLTLKPASGAAVTLKVQGFDDTSFFRLASDNGTGVNGINGTLLTLSADPPAGGPYIIDNGDGTSTRYVPNPTATVAKTITHFAALNGTGAVLSTIIDNADQTSLIYAYNPTTTVKQTATQFTGTDPNTGAPAGSKVSVVIDNTDGTSLIYAYNPSSTVTQTTTKFSATNPDGSAAGTKVSAVVDNTDGTSLVYAYNPTATVKQVTTRFSATDPTNGAPAGVRLSDVVDNVDGTALVYAYNLNSAIRLTATLYSGTDPNNGAPTGNAVSLTVDYTTNQSSVQSFAGDGTSTTTYYAGPDGTGAVIPGLSGSAKAEAAPISAGSLGVGAGPSQFLPGAAAATVLPAVPTIIGFDASANQLDLSALLASDRATLAYQSGGGEADTALPFRTSPATLLQGLGGTVTDATMLMIKGIS